MNSMISFEPLPSTTFSRLQAELFGDGAAEGPAAAVRVEVRALQRIPHGGDRLRRGAERVFVGGELDDVRGLKTHLAGQFLDRLARFVGDQLSRTCS